MSFPIPFVGGSYQGRSRNLNSQRCVNLFPFGDQEGGKVIVALHGTPGLKEFTDFGFWAEVRGLHVFNDKLYAVVGNKLYDAEAAPQALGPDPPAEGEGGRTLYQYAALGTLDTSIGYVWMQNNGTQMMIVDGQGGYVLDLNGGFKRVDDADFPENPKTLTFQDGYFIVTIKDSGKFYISAAYDAHDWDALDFATAEAKPDKLRAAMSYSQNLWLFGDNTVEVWYNSGDPSFPFYRLGGAVMEDGIGAQDSVAKSSDSLFWFSSLRQVRAASGLNARIISTPQIDYQLSTYAVVSDAIGFTYTLEGYTFYVLTFPTAKKTWQYCQTTGFWNELSSTPSYDRHRANCSAYYNGKIMVGDYANGKLYTLDLDTYTDDGAAIKRKRTASAFDPQNRQNVFFSSLEIEFESGVGLVTGQGSDPQAMLTWSDDGGHTWSNEHWASIGKIGKYNHRVKWNRLGQSKDRIFSVDISDPVKVVILSAYLEAYLSNG